MGIKSYYEASKRDIDRELEKYLNRHEIDKGFNDIDDSKLSELVYTREEAENILLKKSDRKSFLIELKRNIKPQVLDNMAKRLDGKTKEDIEEERKEQLKKFAKNMEDPEAIEENLLSEENLDENSKEKDIKVLRSEVIKAVYEEALKEYYRLVSDLQTGFNGEVSRGSSDNGTKMNTKLIMHQNYLRKLDMWYGAINNGEHIAYDERISDIVNREENKKLNNDLIVNEKREAKISQIEELNNKLDKIAKKMVEISNLEDNSVSKTEEIAALSKEYSEVKFELANIKPSIGILYAEEREAEKNEDFKKRLGLLTYKNKTDKKVLDSQNKSKEKRDLVQDENSTERIDEIANNAIKVNLQKAEDALYDFDEALNCGNIEDAIQSLKVANELCHTASDNIENVNITGNKIEEIKSKIKEKNDEDRKEELNKKLGTGAVYSDNELLLKDLKSIRDNIKSGIDRNKSIAERNSTSERVR